MIAEEIDSFNKCFKEVNPSNYIKINVEDDNNNYRNIDKICMKTHTKEICVNRIESCLIFNFIG